MQMIAKRFFKPGAKTPFAVRIKEPLPSAANVETIGAVKFIPEFGAVAFNWKTYPQKIFRSKRLHPPVEVGGIKATLRVVVWAGENGKEIRLLETWYFKEKPCGRLSPQNFIEQATRVELEQAAQPKPARFFKTEIAKDIDPLENACVATLELLKKEYPELAKAIASGSLDASGAFALDLVRLTGYAPANVNLSDANFVAKLADAWQTYDRRNDPRAKRKTKVDAVDWFLANPRNWAELHKLKPDEIAARVKTATDIFLKPGAVEKRIERLKLITPRKPGHPTESEF